MKINEVTNTNEAIGPIAGGASFGAILGAALGGAPGALAFGVIGGLVGLASGAVNKQDVATVVKTSSNNTPAEDFFKSDGYLKLEAEIFDDIVSRYTYWKDWDSTTKLQPGTKLQVRKLKPKYTLDEYTLDPYIRKVLQVVEKYAPDQTDKAQAILEQISSHMLDRIGAALDNVEGYEYLNRYRHTTSVTSDNPYIDSSSVERIVKSNKTFADRAANQKKLIQKNDEIIKHFETVVLPEMYKISRSDDNEYLDTVINVLGFKSNDFNDVNWALAKLLEGIHYEGWLKPEYYGMVKKYRDAWMKRHFDQYPDDEN